MQESLQASATGAPASYSELRFSPGIGKIYKRLHKRSKEGGRNWIGEGDWRMEAKEPGGVPKNRDLRRTTDAFICCLTKYTILSILKLRFDF